MKKYAIINFHSCVDLITNSSTELFMVNNQHNIDIVKKVLMELLLSYKNLASIGAFGEYLMKNNKFILGEKQETLENAITEEDFDNIFNVFEYTRKMYDENCGWDYENESNIGKIIIESTSDNSIPYEMFEWIENIFNSDKYHLG